MNRQHVGRDHPCADNVFGGDAAIAHVAEDESRADQIDELVDGASCDQFVAEAMRADIGELGERIGEVRAQEAADEVRIVDQHGVLEALDEIDLAVGAGQRKLGAGEAGEAGMAFVQRVARRYRGIHPGQHAASGDGLEVVAELGQVRAAA